MDRGTEGVLFAHDNIMPVVLLVIVGIDARDAGGGNDPRDSCPIQGVGVTVIALRSPV